MRFVGILLFFAALGLPSLVSYRGWLGEFAIDENRARAEWPAFAPADNPVGYVNAAEAWFDDHFGGRDFLIRLKTQIDYSVFHTSSRVHVGKDGWLFYRSVLDVEKPAIEDRLATEAVPLTRGIERLSRDLESRGVHLIIMPVFLGDVFYPGELPSSVPSLPKPGRFRETVETWRTLPDVTVFDSTPILREVAATRPVFHKTDFHWNDPAAFEVARRLVDAIGRREGNPNGTWDHTLTIEQRLYSGKEATFLPLFAMPVEDGLFVKPTWSDPQMRYVTNSGSYEWVSTQGPADARLLPAICVVGDSFFDGLSNSGIASYFRKLYFVRWRSDASLYGLLEQLPAECRYVLIEFIETQGPAISSLTDAAEHLAPRRQ